MLKPMYGVNDEEWVLAIGRFMLNMGAIEAASILVGEIIEGSTWAQRPRKDLVSRLGWIRKNFPQTDRERHQQAMSTLRIAQKMSAFRDAIAHSPLGCGLAPDGTKQIHGILDIGRNELITLAELKARIDESALLASQLLEMQRDFRSGA